MAKWPGGLIRKTPVTPAGPYQNGAAPGVWSMADAAYWTKQGLWPTAGKTAGWIAVWGDSNFEQFTDVAVDTSGNVFATGQTNASGVYSYATVKYSPLGAIQWQRRLSGANDSVGRGIFTDSSGNVFLSGDSYYNPGFIKYDTNGNLQYQKYLDNGGIEVGYGAALDPSGNFYAISQVRIGVDTFYVTKTDSSGNVLWQRYLGIAGQYFYGHGGSADSSNVYVCGNGGSTGYAILAAYSLAGTLQWQRTFTGSTTMDFAGCAADGLGNVYAVGYEQTATWVGFVAKYNSSGVLQWQRKLSGPSSVYFQRCATDAAGNVYAVGNSGSAIIMVCYNPSGVLQWQRTLTISSGSLVGNGIAASPTGSYYICGSTSVPTTNGLLARFSTTGSQLGTYALAGYNYTYAASSLADAAATYTDAAGAMTSTNSTIALTTASYTDAATTLTSSVVTV